MGGGNGRRVRGALLVMFAVAVAVAVAVLQRVVG